VRSIPQQVWEQRKKSDFSLSDTDLTIREKGKYYSDSMTCYILQLTSAGEPAAQVIRWRYARAHGAGSMLKQHARVEMLG
jgi:hypothetical protein